MATKRRSSRKLFVLDTNVLLHDPNALFKFQEHDVFLPFAVLEELDKHKSGLQDINRNARQSIRLLGELLKDGNLSKGFSLSMGGTEAATGRIFFQDQMVDVPPDQVRKADNEILAVVAHLRQRHGAREVVLVSKDINLRVKAQATGLVSEDYLNDHAVEDADLLYTGVTQLDEDPLSVDGVESYMEAGRTYYKLPRGTRLDVRPNEFLVTPDGLTLQAIIRSGQTLLRTLPRYSGKSSVWGISALNSEQTMALDLLMDPDIDLVSLLGPAGTGKTLLTLAAALQNTLEDAKFQEIIYTRATIPMGEDIGFLPGSEEDKMHPWLGALEDSLDVLLGHKDDQDEWRKKTTRDLVMQRIRIKSIAFMRGRTFHNKLVILDEAQNLTPKQIKALITRAGPGSKIILLGNLSQIDTPYLTENGSGLTYAVERFKSWPHFGHVILTQGERSRLASFANDNL